MHSQTTNPRAVQRLVPKKKRKPHAHGDGSYEEPAEDEHDAHGKLAEHGGDAKAKGDALPALPPGCMAESWRYMDEEKTLLLISGYVWDVKELAKGHGMPLKGPCWPFLLTRAADQNRPSRCDKWGHENEKSTAHKFSIDHYLLVVLPLFTPWDACPGKFLERSPRCELPF